MVPTLHRLDALGGVVNVPAALGSTAAPEQCCSILDTVGMHAPSAMLPQAKALVSRCHSARDLALNVQPCTTP